jgi:simple sugar transport system permease protein
MMKSNSRWAGLGFGALAVVLALVFTSIVLLLVDADPIAAYTNIIIGSIGSDNKIAETLVAWVPLVLATCGLLITFSSGLWNIGVEGQITLGAIFTTWVLRLLQPTDVPPWIAIVLSMLAGMAGGAIWAALAGALKVFGGVNEIFSGLGLNFVATAITLWLIFGPWKRPGVGSMSGTEPFDQALWLPVIPGLRISAWSLLVAMIVLVIVFLILQGTYFGLKLKAVGKNPRSAFMLGIPTVRYTLIAFLLCGAFAGLAGSLQVTAVYHRLIPSISSGYGFLGMLVGMLVNFQPLWAALVAFGFAALNIGSIQLPIVLKLDSTLSGVLQGALVLAVLMMDGVRRRFMQKS